MTSKELDKKRQKKWQENGIYKVVENPNKPKFYVLDMFPYPSGSALHVGHPKGYIATDGLARKKMLEGFSVLHPMGFDTFGLGTEQYAIENKTKPQVVSEQNIEKFINQLQSFGCTYDRDRSVSTADPEYFKWTQWIFLKLYEHYYDEKEGKAKPIEELKLQIEDGKLKIDGDIEEYLNKQRLAYIDFKPINRCPKCKTGLANEDLDDGKCERCGSEVEQKPMKQRVLRITRYAERLLTGLDKLDRDESMKELERNWIGKSEGTQFKMNIRGSKESFEVYTTRVDTVFGMSFVVMAPEHPLVEKITTPENKDAVERYKEAAKYKTQLERMELQKEKTGQFTGSYAINPFNEKEVPIYIGDYVLANYGTGVVMAVPAHDDRDFEFANKYGIGVIQSIAPVDENHPDYEAINKCEVCYPDKGILVNSGEFTGLKSDEAIKKMREWLDKNGIGFKKVNYKIQDRVFSRQRYRGEPFPVVFCDKCGIVPMKESDLPLLLPDVENYEPTGTEEGPLADVEEWINVDCPICGSKAKRESNTMPGWAGSSWYRMRYMDNKNDKELVSKERDEYRKNVDVYVGGAEHVTRHMIYARFWQKFLFDIGVVSQDEPFLEYHSVGLIMGEDGRKMSKRRGNVVNPDDIINEHGADTLRTYEMFMGPFDQSIAWSTNGIKGVKKFLDKIDALKNKIVECLPEAAGTQGNKLNLNLVLLHKTIKKVSEDIDEFRFNTAVSQLMILVNQLSDEKEIDRDIFRELIILVSPFAPHLAEELREYIGEEFSIFTKGKRPQYDQSIIDGFEIINLAVQINGKMRGTITAKKDLPQENVLNLVKGDSRLNSYITGEPRKIIYVPGKIINIII